MNVEIIVITDRSGSMESIRDDVIGGFNAFLDEQKLQPGAARMTYAQFDDRYDAVYQAQPIETAQKLTRASFVPRGGTALMDAIGRTMNEQGARIDAEGWAEKVIYYIVTDGGENASREFRRDQIKTMIEQAQARGQAFIFQAANQDAFAVGASYGIAGATTQNFEASAQGTLRAYASASTMTSSLRSGQ